MVDVQRGASTLEARAEKAYRGAVVAATVVFIGLPPLVGYLVSLAADLSASARYYEILAEGVFPVLLVAGVVEWGLVARDQLEIEASELMRFKLKRITVAYGGAFVAAEGVALYAVAGAHDSTFLIVTLAAYALSMTFDLIVNVAARTTGGLERFAPSREVGRMTRSVRDRLRAKADEYEDKAQRLRSRADAEEGGHGGQTGEQEH